VAPKHAILSITDILPIAIWSTT